MPSSSMVSASDFYRSWTHSLSNDFQQDGVPAASEPSWLSQTTVVDVGSHVESIALSPDGTMLAAGVGSDIRIYDVASSQLTHTLRGHTGMVSSIEFHPGGQKLVSGITQRLPRTLEYTTKLWDLDAAPDQSLAVVEEAASAAAAAAQPILSRIWSAEDLECANLREEIHRLLSSAQMAVDQRNGRNIPGQLLGFGSRAFSNDGRSLLVCGKQREDVIVIDVATLSKRVRLAGHTDHIMWAATSPDDKVVATSCWDKTVRIWSMEDGQTLRVLEGAMNQNWAGAFSPDGALIAVGEGNNMVHTWRVETGELLYTFRGFQGWVRSLSFSPDGLHLAAGSSGGTVKVFNVASGECEQDWQIDITKDLHAKAFLEMRSVQYTSRGDLFFSSSEGRVFGYRAAQNLKCEIKEPGQSNNHQVLISMDGSKLLIGLGSSVGMWEIF